MGLGFGALKAMNDTLRKNRENLKAIKRKPFDKNAIPRISHRHDSIADSVTLTEEERSKLKQALSTASRQDTLKKVIVLIASIVLFVTLVFLLSDFVHG